MIFSMSYFAPNFQLIWGVLYETLFRGKMLCSDVQMNQSVTRHLILEILFFTEQLNYNLL